MKAIITLWIALLAPAVPAAEPPRQVTALAEEMVTRLYLLPLEIHDARISTVLDWNGDELSPLRATTRV